MRSVRQLPRRKLTPSRADLECPRIVIADDHVPTRTGVRIALEEDGFIVCAEEATAKDAVAAALRDPPDLCLLDVDMPGGGIEAAETIRSALPQTQVVMLSESAADDELFAALLAGASGYLLTGTNPSRLGPALRDVLNGGAALPRLLTARLIDEFRTQARHASTPLTRPTDHDLTRREWEVLDCLRDGLTTRRTAKRLFISETTVRRHIGSILKKLDVRTREAAIKVAAKRSRNLNDE
jgi:two-component system, NarL family, nitrate/nitrite response regulator NarL